MSIAMQFAEPLVATRLVKRYKRFLADVIHPDKGEITVHCPNTGSMKNCWQPGWTAWVSDSHNPKRKYRYSWVLSESPDGALIGINTQLSNQIALQGIEAGKVRELSDFETIRSEVKYGKENSRIDLLLSEPGGRQCFIEVKNVTLMEQPGCGFFPDAVSVRGQKHLRELIECVKQGHRAVLFFLVQHSQIETVSVARHIDPDYAELFDQAIAAGVEVIAYDCAMSAQGISLQKTLSVVNG